MLHSLFVPCLLVLEKWMGKQGVERYRGEGWEEGRGEG